MVVTENYISRNSLFPRVFVPGTTGKVSFLMSILPIIRLLSCCKGEYDFFKGICAKYIELVKKQKTTNGLCLFLRQLPNYVMFKCSE